MSYRYATPKHLAGWPGQWWEVRAVGEPEPELLVVLEAECPGAPPPEDVMNSLEAFGAVVGHLPPRLVLLAAPAERAADVARLPGVTGAFTSDPPAAIRDTFDDAGRLFVDAWVARHGEAPPPPGDGLHWDTPGWLPPDLPPASHPHRSSER